MRSQIRSLTFNNNSKVDSFTGEYNNQIVTGNNKSGKFLINNFKNFSEIAITCLEFEVAKRFNFNLKDIKINSVLHTI